MRDLVKNQQKLYQKRYTGKTEILDGDGFATGSFTETYGPQLTIYKNIVSKGYNEVQPEMYGYFQKHTKVIVTSEPFPVGLQDLFWVEVAPTAQPDFKVGGIYKGLNTLIIGLDARVKPNV
jgi:hypothetical protein